MKKFWTRLKLSWKCFREIMKTEYVSAKYKFVPPQEPLEVRHVQYPIVDWQAKAVIDMHSMRSISPNELQNILTDMFRNEFNKSFPELMMTCGELLSQDNIVELKKEYMLRFLFC